MVSTLNYKHLRYFWAVAKSGAIVRASEQFSVEAVGVIKTQRGLVPGLHADECFPSSITGQC